MNDPLEQQTVLDFVLESEKNLGIAMHLTSAFSIARQRIAAALLDDLEIKIEPELDSDGSLYNCKNDMFVSHYPGFKVWRESWGDDLCVNLENQTREGGTVIGIWRPQRPTDNRPPAKVC